MQVEKDEQSMNASSKVGRLAVAATAIPLMLIALAAPAQAAELAPVAEAVDGVVADALSSVGGALDALGLAA